LLEYLGNLVQQAIQEHQTRLPTNTFPADTYNYEIGKEIDITDQLFVDDLGEIGKIRLRIKYQLEVIRPAIISVYEVETRGRVYNLETYELGDLGMAQVTVVEAGSQPDRA
jgi:hypothetical protein